MEAVCLVTSLLMHPYMKAPLEGGDGSWVNPCAGGILTFASARCVGKFQFSVKETILADILKFLLSLYN